LKVIGEVAERQGAPELEPSEVVTDPVRFAVYGPQRIAVNVPFKLDVWAFLGEQKEKVDDLALRMGESCAGDDAEGRVVQASELAIFVQSPFLDISNPVKPLTWHGQATVESFDCRLHADSRHPGLRVYGKVVVTLHGLLLVEIRFELLVAAAAEPARGAVSYSATRPRAAFASYASVDRINVIRSVQGIMKGAPDLDIFLDVDTLRSGDNWEEKILAFISTSDILYLFWSRAASQSEWVSREWHLGLRQKGIDFIDPFPLESPEIVPPPAELRALHFNDRYLIQILAQQQIDMIKAAGGAP